MSFLIALLRSFPSSRLLLGFLGVLPFVATSRSHAQISLPGGIRVQVPNGRTPAARNAPTRESPDHVCPNLVAWVKPLFDEYPQQDLMRIDLGRLAKMEIPLFADQNFKPFFHKSYTEMTPQDLDTIFHQQIIVCDQSTYRTQLPGIEYAFLTRSTNSPLSYTHLPASLAALQTARDNVARQLQTMQSLPLSAQSYDTLRASETAVAADLPLVWPGERRVFQQAYNTAQQRLAPAALTAKIEALLAAPPSLSAVSALREAPAKYRDLFSQVPQDQAASLHARMDARISDLGTAIVAEQRKTMLSFTGTRDGLKQGAQWLQQFKAVDVSELNLPGAADLATEYEHIRQRQLVAFEPQLRRTIQSAPDEASLQGILEEAYPLPSDRDTPAYSLMQQAVAQRAVVFEKQRQAEDAARQRAEAAREASISPPSSAPGHPGSHRSAPADTADPVPHAGFTAHGLQNEAALLAIYRGDFDKVDFGRDDARFGSAAGGYMEAYWDNCSRFLTSDRVDITVPHCTGGYSHMVNMRTGMQIGPDTCDGWSNIPTGKFADRRLYTAVKATEGQQEKNMIGAVIKNVDNAKDLSDIFTKPMNMAAGMVQMSQDAGALVSMNGCTSPELKHFQSNLLAFALGEPGIHPDGSRVEYATTRAAAPGQAFRDSNYRSVLEDMVSDAANSWAVNKYVAGSVHGVQVTKRDAMGRPASVSGSYSYLRMGSSRQPGEVTLTFSDGMPSCLYFSDLPSNCVTPNRKLTTAYGNGAYLGGGASR